MTEECSTCKRGVTKYVLFEVSELEDLEENDSKLRGHYEVIVCNDCWAGRYRSFLPGTH
jgi:hypothetical protein